MHLFKSIRFSKTPEIQVIQKSQMIICSINNYVSVIKKLMEINECERI